MVRGNFCSLYPNAVSLVWVIPALWRMLVPGKADALGCATCCSRAGLELMPWRQHLLLNFIIFGK